MSNSSLVSYIKLSPNHYNGRNHAIDTISIHCMAGNCTIETCGEIFAPKSRQASSNYGIGSDGRIGMYVEEKNASWCTSSYSNDNRAVTIEVANNGPGPEFHVSDKAMKSLINLCADICIRNGISELKWKGDPKLIGDVSKQNMTVHRWFANKNCPGDYLYSKHDYIAKQVNKLIKLDRLNKQCPLKVEVLKDGVKLRTGIGSGKITKTYKKGRVLKISKVYLHNGLFYGKRKIAKKRYMCLKNVKIK